MKHEDCESFWCVGWGVCDVYVKTNGRDCSYCSHFCCCDSCILDNPAARRSDLSSELQECIDILQDIEYHPEF